MDISIRNDAEYSEALIRQARNRQYERVLLAELTKRGIMFDEIERVMQPSLSFHALLDDDIIEYEAKTKT